MKLIPRTVWGARYAKGSTAIGATKGVTLHWEGPHMGTFSHDRCAEKVRGIERFHSVERGWSGIAYNFVVCPHGYTFEGRGIGVRSAANGTTQTNADWYAVCYLGGEGDGFTDDGQAGTLDAVRYLRANGAGPAVNGHRDHKATDCPGDEIYRWLRSTNFDATPAPTTQEDDLMASLDEPLNVHDPKGLLETRGITVREALMIAVVHAVSGRRAARRVWENANKKA